MSVYLVSRKVHEIINEAKKQGHQNIYLNYQQLKEIPEELLQLDRVESVFLKYNMLEKLPSKMWKLENLVELYLHSNLLDSLPEEIGLVSCLKSLNISNNCLKSLPSSIGQLTQLEKLHVSNNQLNSLPESLGSLQSSLKVLDVINNDLAALPWQLCYCCKLETLLIDGNRIQWIPQQFTQLKHLKELSASRNKLTCIPQDVDEMVLLENILLDSNTNLCALPATVLRLDNLLMLGLNCCGNQNNSESSNMDLSRCYRDVAFVGNSVQNVCPLLELCLRAAHILLNSSFRPCLLPNNLDTLLRSPTGHCFQCAQPFFVGVFGCITDLKKAIKITRNPRQSDINTKLPILFAMCSFNCLKVIEDALRDIT